jgi:hypothetical protein
MTIMMVMTGKMEIIYTEDRNRKRQRRTEAEYANSGAQFGAMQAVILILEMLRASLMELAYRVNDNAAQPMDKSLCCPTTSLHDLS